MIQHHKFPDGGFVLHKVLIQNQKYSAWFDSKGTLLDAERVWKDGQRVTAISFKTHRKLVAKLTQIGKQFTESKRGS